MTSSTKERNDTENHRHSVRKWVGVVWLLFEVNLIGGTIFGFPALFSILSRYEIYTNGNNCANNTHLETKQSACERHEIRHYQVNTEMLTS